MIEKWWHRSSSEELKPIPWLHPEAIDYLESLLEPDFKVLEHGSGGSTLWFAERVASVIAIENDADWYKQVESELPEKARVMLWQKEILPNFRGKFDLLFIDGAPVIDRALYLRNIIKFVKPGGYVVLDNANRPEYAVERDNLAKKAQLLKRVDGNEPRTRYLVTEFYRLLEDDDEEG